MDFNEVFFRSNFVEFRSHYTQQANSEALMILYNNIINSPQRTRIINTQLIKF